jgi:hypothetical protein
VEFALAGQQVSHPISTKTVTENALGPRSSTIVDTVSKEVQVFLLTLETTVMEIVTELLQLTIAVYVPEETPSKSPTKTRIVPVCALATLPSTLAVFVGTIAT